MTRFCEEDWSYETFKNILGIDHNSAAYMRRVSHDDMLLGETISMQLMLQMFLRNGDLQGIQTHILGREHISATNMTILMHLTKMFIST